MTTAALAAEATREIVAQYTTRRDFDRAVAALLAAGFERTDLSVLATHDGLDVTEQEHGALGAALDSQLTWLGPIAIAGTLIAAAGPVGAALAVAAAAGAGAIALRPLLYEVVENVHAESFAGAVTEGRILLWVRTAHADVVARAEKLLVETGGTALARLSEVRRESPAE
jgi:hypothetical protein